MNNPDYIRFKGALYRKALISMPSYKPAPSRGVRPKQPQAPTQQRTTEQIEEAKSQLYAGLELYTKQVKKMVEVKDAIQAKLNALTKGRTVFTEPAYAAMDDAFQKLNEAAKSFAAVLLVLEATYD